MANCVKCGQPAQALVGFEAILSTGDDQCGVTTSARATICGKCGGAMIADIVKLAGTQADALVKAGGQR